MIASSMTIQFTAALSSAQEHLGIEHWGLPLLKIPVLLSNEGRPMLNKPDCLSMVTSASNTENT